LAAACRSSPAGPTSRGTVAHAAIIEQARGNKTGEKDADGNDLTTRVADAGLTRKASGRRKCG
jgi:hypothetical protein